MFNRLFSTYLLNTGHYVAGPCALNTVTDFIFGAVDQC